MQLKNKGISSAEALFIIFLIAIISLLAYPALESLIIKNKYETTKILLANSIFIARETSIFENKHLELCGTSNFKDCDTDWSKGWLIREYQSKEVISAYENSSKATVLWKGISPTVRFSSQGTTAIGNGSFIICVKNNIRGKIVLSRQGRVRYVETQAERASASVDQPSCT